MSGHDRRRRAKQLQFESLQRHKNKGFEDWLATPEGAPLSHDEKAELGRRVAEAVRRQCEGAFIHGQRGIGR